MQPALERRTWAFRTVRNDGTHFGDEEPYLGVWAYLNLDYTEMMSVGGYGALGATKGPYPTRGWGWTEPEAIALLCALLSEEREFLWDNMTARKALLGN